MLRAASKLSIFPHIHIQDYIIKHRTESGLVRLATTKGGERHFANVVEARGVLDSRSGIYAYIYAHRNAVNRCIEYDVHVCMCGTG